MKVEIPEQLKSDMPPTKWGKLLTATPVVMAVVATMLAGLSSSEMTRAQYARALAAQQQSKAGDQWAFFQAKRLRGAMQRSSLDLLRGTGAVHPLTAAGLKAAAAQPALQPDPPEAAKARTALLAVLDAPAGQQALSMLERGEMPSATPGQAPDADIKAALEAVESHQPEPEVAALLKRVTNQALEKALRAARDRVQALDAATEPVNQAIDRLEELVGSLAASASLAATPGGSLSRDFTVARLRYTAQRYDAEARLNQAVANLYELQVRKSNIAAERHHNRSQRFFYGMLAAQLGVIVSTFAMAARQRNLLWALAAVAGLLAIAFAIYVYLYV